jgi:hypothetical protein
LSRTLASTATQSFDGLNFGAPAPATAPAPTKAPFSGTTTEECVRTNVSIPYHSHLTGHDCLPSSTMQFGSYRNWRRKGLDCWCGPLPCPRYSHSIAIPSQIHSHPISTHPYL